MNNGYLLQNLQKMIFIVILIFYIITIEVFLTGGILHLEKVYRKIRALNRFKNLFNTKHSAKIQLMK